MSRIRQPLPEYGTLIRWTVQEVINWLSENKIDCSKCFRDGGVDGNKLVNITEIDLNTIRCPKKYIREILNQVSQVSRPGAPARAGGGGYGVRNNQRHVPFNETIHNQDDKSGSEDDCWSDDEFDSDYDQDENNSVESYDSPDNNPKAPPRPNRREVPAIPRGAVPLPASSRRQLPAQPEPEEEEFYEEPEEASLPPSRGKLPVPNVRGRLPPPEVRGRAPPPELRGRPPPRVPDLDGPNEDYEDPDASIKVSHFHGGPLPKPPTQVNKHVPIGQRKPPPVPDSPRDPSDSESDIEEYEDPDSTVIRKAPPPPNFPRRPPPPPTEPEEEYEEPDAVVAKKPPQKSSGARRPLPPPVSSVPSVRNRAPVQEEEYEDPDETVLSIQKPQPPPISKLPRKLSSTASELPAYEMPEEEPAPPPVPRNVPRKKSHEPKVQVQVEEEEFYEIPDETDSAPSKMAPQKYNQQEEEEVYEVPDSDSNEDQDDYLDMDQEITTLPPSKQIPDQDDYLDLDQEITTLPPSKQIPDYVDIVDDNIGMQNSRVPSVTRGKPDTGPRRAAMPLPGENRSHPTKKGADRRAPVEPPDDNEEVRVPQKIKGVQVFPVLPNGVKEPVNQPPRQGRSLPPPPTVTPDRREQEKKEPAKPVATTTPQKSELTETDLLRQKWYHGKIKRIDAEIKLKQLSIDGMYLIRKSSQGSDQPYTLQIFYRGKCYNLPIRRRSDNLFAVGKEEKDAEKAFSSLLDLVNGFKQNILVLSGGAETKLVKSLPKT